MCITYDMNFSLRFEVEMRPQGLSFLFLELIDTRAHMYNSNFVPVPHVNSFWYAVVIALEIISSFVAATQLMCHLVFSYMYDRADVNWNVCIRHPNGCYVVENVFFFP